MKDSLTAELRKIEKEVDHHYKSNPLMNLPFATAAWSLLAFAEDWALAQINRGNTQHETAIAHTLVNNLNDPMCWLYYNCKRGGQVPFVYNEDFYKASWDLFKLGEKYGWFVSAYTLASRGWIGLELQGATIQPTENLFKGIEYEAYNHLIKLRKSQDALSSAHFDNFPIDAVAHSLKVKGERFSYKLKPKIVADTIKAIVKPILDGRFSLPSEWRFTHYSLGDFRKVVEAISAMAYIHVTMRRMAADLGCFGMGYSDSIYVRSFDDLLRQVIRYSGVSKPEVQSIFDDLSYGKRGISKPDPVLQPLIKLNSETCAIMPHLWLASAAERNLTVLLNKLPSERKIYAKLVDEKERLMRERFMTCLSPKGVRFICKNVPGLPDIDLAIINESEKACLLLELKWFIAPAEIREVIEKYEEIQKGICQILQLKQAFANNHELLLEKLEIDSRYSLEGAVVSENWIGNGEVQSPEIPVIQAGHLIEKLKVAKNLESVMEWLKTRKYLPKEEEHFKVHRTTATISNWHLKWYKIELIDDAFFPL